MATVESLQDEVSELESENRPLKKKLQERETDLKSLEMITEKVLFEETPTVNTLRDCFPLLQRTPKQLVDKHGNLVKSSDDYDNASFPYLHENQVFIFQCHKERNFFSKDQCNIKVWMIRARK